MKKTKNQEVIEIEENMLDTGEYHCPNCDRIFPGKDEYYLHECIKTVLTNATEETNG